MFCEKKKIKFFNCIRSFSNWQDHRIKLHKQSDYIALITIILCVSIGSTLLILFAIFLIRRRAHLRNKLIDDVSINKKPVKFDDEERLVRAERQNTKPWYSFIRREQVDETPKQDYQVKYANKLKENIKNAHFFLLLKSSLNRNCD